MRKQKDISTIMMKEYFNISKIPLLKGIEPILVVSITGLLIGICLLIYSFSRKRKDNSKIIYFKIVSWVVISFAIFAAAIGFLLVSSGRLKLQSNYDKKAYLTIEGYVTNFFPMPNAGGKHESFFVNGIYFDYSDYYITGGFNNTKSHGGPISDGKYVRIFYNKEYDYNLILGLWVRE
jgi:hypothetical protein